KRRTQRAGDELALVGGWIAVQQRAEPDGCGAPGGFRSRPFLQPCHQPRIALAVGGVARRSFGDLGRGPFVVGALFLLQILGARGLLAPQRTDQRGPCHTISLGDPRNARISVPSAEQFRKSGIQSGRSAFGAQQRFEQSRSWQSSELASKGRRGATLGEERGGLRVLRGEGVRTELTDR